MENLLTILRYVYWVDFILFGVFYLVGLWAVEKEMKDTWKGKMTMKKSNKLSKEWIKKHPILNFFQGFKYETHWKYRMPGEFIDNVKHFIERGKKGYSVRDVWGFDYYLSDVIVKGLTDLKGMVHGVPSNMIGSQAMCITDSDEDKKALQSWKSELDKIIWTFEITKNIQNRNWIPVFDEKDRVELKKYERRLNTKTKDEDKLFEGMEDIKYHLMTKAEMKKYNNGWELFKKYYFDLWD